MRQYMRDLWGGRIMWTNRNYDHNRRFDLKKKTLARYSALFFQFHKSNSLICLHFVRRRWNIESRLSLVREIDLRRDKLDELSATVTNAHIGAGLEIPFEIGERWNGSVDWGSRLGSHIISPRNTSIHVVCRKLRILISCSSSFSITRVWVIE